MHQNIGAVKRKQGPPVDAGPGPRETGAQPVHYRYREDHDDVVAEAVCTGCGHGPSELRPPDEWSSAADHSRRLSCGWCLDIDRIFLPMIGTRPFTSASLAGISKALSRAVSSVDTDAWLVGALRRGQVQRTTPDSQTPVYAVAGLPPFDPFDTRLDGYLLAPQTTVCENRA